jgi:YVTN family beta-propeller protein
MVKNLYTITTIPNVFALSNHNTKVNSIGIEGGVPGIYVQSYPADVTINSKTNKIYVVNYYSNTVSIIDGKTNTVIGNISVGTSPQKIVVSSETDRVYIYNYVSPPTLYAIDGYTNKIVKNLTIPTPVNSMVVGPFDIIYTTTPRSNEVTLIDGPTLQRVYSVPVGNATDSLSGITVNPNTNEIYVVNTGNPSSKSSRANVVVIKGPMGFHGGDEARIEDDIPIRWVSAADAFWGKDIAVNPSTNMIYVTDWNHSLVNVINLTTDRIIKNVTVGKFPLGIAINPNTNKIYVQNIRSDTISVIDGNTNRVEASVPVSDHLPGPYANRLPINGIAVNPNTNSTYAPNPFFDKMTVINGKTNNLLVRVSIKVNPTNSGNINCNKNEISRDIYLMYDLGTKLNCRAQENPGFVFSSWSNDISPNLRDNSNETFNVTNYGSLTANFNQATPAVSIPPDFLDAVILGPTVGAILGGVLAWYIPYLMGKRSAKKDINKSKATVKDGEKKGSEGYGAQFV